MTQNNAMNDFLAAVKRGEKLHPGPYTLKEWHDALMTEWEEVQGEEQESEREKEEIVDLGVVAYRTAQAIRDVFNLACDGFVVISRDDFKHVFAAEVDLFVATEEDEEGSLPYWGWAEDVVSCYEKEGLCQACNIDRLSDYYKAVLGLAVMCFFEAYW